MSLPELITLFFFFFAKSFFFPTPTPLSFKRGLLYSVIPREKTSANPDMFDCSDYFNLIQV